MNQGAKMDLTTVRQNEIKLYYSSHAAEQATKFAQTFSVKRASEEIPSIEER